MYNNFSLRTNVVFNYVGQLYATCIGILVLPLFLSHLGGEAYGLIGFFTLLQAWMSLLDLGMSPTLGREVARLRDNPSESGRLRTVVNTLETVFFVTGIVLAAILFQSREWISTRWLSFDQLSLDTVTTAVTIMAITVSIRWISSINRSGVNAYEAQVWMNVADVVINTLRFPVALWLMIVIDGGILLYFYYQLALVLVEVAVIRLKFRMLLPRNDVQSQLFSFSELKRVAPFALSVAYTGAIWVVITQLDKLLLSKFLTLTAFGYFTLVATVVAGVTMLSGPVNKAVLPRMTSLLAAERTEEMIDIYRLASRIVASTVLPLALIIALLPEMVIYTWTGDSEAASWTSRILPLFAIGSALLSIMTFPYLLQSAYGILKYHVRWNTLMVVLNVPLVIYAVTHYGAEGAAWVWLAFRLLALLLWVPFIHGKFAPGLHLRWLLEDLLPATLVSVLVMGLVNYYVQVDPYADRVISFFFLSGLAGFSIFLSLCFAMRDQLARRIFG
ncbi:hypothetical protein [Pseudomonas sediminis]|uniref:Polysaccharide biosynthesis protein n=1 Tax=Pseudomonas sediminis TaxID=1691904 RepID=A0ABX6SER1_9PSED|nr:hypothetical protein [Pseudomonas sediminis]QNG99599.1 hypothetical protein HNQ25_14960 [Pseudomonas sediminis]